MKSLQNWFEKGLTEYEYIHSMQTHKENLLQVYNQTTLNDEERTFLQSLQTKQLKAIILTADWCGDAMVNLPIFLRLAQEALLETRYLIRDENLELMDQYLTNGTSRSIPIIIFLDKDSREIGKWGPRAPEVQSLVDQLRADVPAKDDPNYEQAFKAFVRELTTRFLTDRELQSLIKDDLIQTLKKLV